MTISVQWAETRNALAQTAADFVQDFLRGVTTPVIALPTGETPIGLYQALAQRHRRDGLSFRAARFFNLDEYEGMPPNHPQSYHAFLHRHFLDHVDADFENIRLLRGDTPDAHQECRAYDEAIAAVGGIDLAILGLGGNGHVAFNEPFDPWDQETHPVTLAEKTRFAHRPNFARAEDVPRSGLTMGIKTLRAARKILLLCAGASKRDAMAALLRGRQDEAWPVTSLIGHKDLTIIAEAELQPVPA
ncbi:MAG TPA: glucosamine-6-phosphate deaminase [Nordella sp.]|nr:glucosamine-6-phosphate deaminase [Nordella sp.]